MYADTGRRVFVRNLAVGLPALAGVAAWTPALSAAPGLARRTVAVDTLDSHIDRTLRELAGFYNQLAGRRLTPADARIIAPQFRSLVGYRQISGRDEELSKAIRGLITQQGRERLTLMEPDLTPMRQGLQYYGVRGHDLSLGRVDARARGLALDVLAKDGAVGFYGDALGIIGMFITASQTTAFCDFVQDMMRVLEAMASVFCVAAVFAPIFGPECFATSVVLSILKFINFADGC